MAIAHTIQNIYPCISHVINSIWQSCIITRTWSIENYMMYCTWLANMCDTKAHDHADAILDLNNPSIMHWTYNCCRLINLFVVIVCLSDWPIGPLNMHVADITQPLNVFTYSCMKLSIIVLMYVWCGVARGLISLFFVWIYKLRRNESSHARVTIMSMRVNEFSLQQCVSTLDLMAGVSRRVHKRTFFEM